MKKRIWLGIGLVVLVLIILLNIIQKEEGKEVETAKVHYGNLVSSVTGDGIIKAKTQVNISSQVMGRIEKLYVKEGDLVSKGKLLCLLDQKSYQAQYELAKARYEQARAVWERSETLFHKNLIAQEEYERLSAEYKMAEANFKDAQDRYEKTEIRSPIAGKVVKLNVEEGETVIIGTMNNPGTVLMVIADLAKMLAEIEVSERDVVDTKPNDPVEIELDAIPNQKFSGFVQKVGYMPNTQQLGEEKATTFEVTVEIIDTSSLLRPGMTCHAKIETNRKDSVLVVPISAVGRHKIGEEEKDGVFIIEKNRAKLVPVKTGIFGETEVEVLAGLKEGDIVITGPYRILSRLRDGDLVKGK
ncbi:MAG: efflux RND transporter periplasmic adaptor subunit [candidate division WOR-3 bacterium]